ncbi:hypothetical protein ACH4OW_33570 [Streptomyces sp. NPDC017056]|uniref:hypothetical protein n=1 Tax=Streptomyces sp. NPDC017056 TaxID=3364973 RepID=UPI0037B6A13A
MTHQQLYFATLLRPRSGRPPVGKQGRRPIRPQPPCEPAQPVPRWTQLRPAVQAPRDLTRFLPEHRNLANPVLMRARAMAEAAGWSRWVAKDVDQALVIVLSGALEDEQTRYSELHRGLRPRGMNIKRTAEILDDLNLLDDDRAPAFQTWLTDRTVGLSDGIRADVAAWCRALHDGGPHSRLRDPDTAAMGYLLVLHALLQQWSQRYDHLREVTRQDILAAHDQLSGPKRNHTLSALRSLFAYCKKNGTVFHNPTARIRVGAQPLVRPLQPLVPHEVRNAVQSAATPAARVALALAAVHAVRPSDIPAVRLDHVDLNGRRLTLVRRAHPLDELTRQVILAWLEHRRRRWPDTANPHLLINQQTAMDTTPVGESWLAAVLRGSPVTLAQLRADRQLEEALAHAPDELHLTEVFGVDDKTAIRYAKAARALLERPFESDPAASPLTSVQGSAVHQDGVLCGEAGAPGVRGGVRELDHGHPHATARPPASSTLPPG